MNDHLPATRHNPSSRRAFLGAGSLAVAWTALGTSRGSSPAWGADANADGSGTAEESFLSVKQFGAVGDGRTDDTQALQQAVAHAKEHRIGMLLLPAGTYLLSDALRLPSHLSLIGAGRGLTVLQAAPETLFPKFKPDPRTADVRQRRTMVTTESVATVRSQVVENIAMAHLTIDWNHCPTDGKGHSCVLIDSADHCRLHDVAFVRCMPSDHPPTLEEMSGAGFRSECIMFSNARHGLMDLCSLTDSGYRPLSVAYGSRDITFQNGLITAEKPVWRHAFVEVHGDGIRRDEHFVRSQVKLLNSTFVLEGGTAQDCICSHTGMMHVENCDFHIRGGVSHLHSILKPFDGSRSCFCVNNRFHCEEDYSSQFGIIASTGDSRPDNHEMSFAGNLVRISFAESTNGGTLGTRALVDFTAGDRRVRVQDNQFFVKWRNADRASVIKVRNAGNFSVANNLIEIEAAQIDRGPHGITIDDAVSGTVTGNTVTGDYHHGIRVTGDSDKIVVTANNVSEARAEGIGNDAHGTVIAGPNLI